MKYHKNYLNNKIIQINNLILHNRNNILQYEFYSNTYLINNLPIKTKKIKVSKYRKFNKYYKKKNWYIFNIILKYIKFK
jgi:hypothetical protein